MDSSFDQKILSEPTHWNKKNQTW